MSNWNILSYAVSGLEMCAADITHTFSHYILSKFPHNTFKKGSVFIDTLGLVNDPKRQSTGLEGANKVTKPICTVTNNGGLTDQWSKEDSGPDVKHFSMFPGTTTDRRLVNNHRLGMIYDKRTGIIIDTIEIRRKLELDFKMEFNSKADLNTIKSYMYNKISIRKNNYLENVTTNIILPNSLLNDVSKLAFNRDEFSLTKDSDVDRFVTYMNKNSMFDFYKKVSDNNQDEVWILMNRIFRMNYFINEMPEKDGEGAEKNSEVFDKFVLNIHAILDFKLPNSYIMNYKIFNGQNKSIISDIYFNNVKSDQNANIPAAYTPSRYVEDREYIKPVDASFILVVREEFLSDTVTALIKFSDIFPEGTVYRSLLQRETKEERKGIFEVHIYECDVIVEESSVSLIDIESDIVCEIKSCDTTVSYMIFIYCNMNRLSRLTPIMEDRIKKSVFPHIDNIQMPIIVGSVPPIGLNPNPPFDIWSSTMTYNQNDCVIYQHMLYKATTNTINCIPNSNNQIWKMLAKFWIDTFSYTPGEFVIYKSMLYCVLNEENIGKIPSKNYTHFAFITILGEISTIFEFIDVSKEIAIGGKFLKGGFNDRQSSNLTGIKNFNCNIIALGA